MAMKLVPKHPSLGKLAESEPDADDSGRNSRSHKLRPSTAVDSDDQPGRFPTKRAAKLVKKSSGLAGVAKGM